MTKDKVSKVAASAEPTETQVMNGSETVEH